MVFPEGKYASLQYSSPAPLPWRIIGKDKKRRPEAETGEPTMIKRLLPLIALLVMTVLPAAQAEEKAARKTDPSGVFSLVIPAGWTMDTSDKESLFSLDSPPSAQGNFNARAEEWSGNKMDELISASETELRRAMKNYQRISLTDRKVGGLEAKALKYTCDYGIQGIPITIETVLVIQAPKVYIFTCGASSEGFASCAATLEGIVASIRWVGKK
jgi:hypothetical protein